MRAQRRVPGVRPEVSKEGVGWDGMGEDERGRETKLMFAILYFVFVLGTTPK